jgi:hypothetical protein
MSSSDIFEANAKAASGPLKGYALWSDAANWDPGLPVNGETVDVFATGGDDDLAALSVLALDLADDSGGPTSLTVTGSSLSIGRLDTDATGASLLEALVLPGAGPVTVTVGGFLTYSTDDLSIEADGAGAKIVIGATTSFPVAPPNSFDLNLTATNGGEIELNEALPDSWRVDFGEGSTGILALHDPGATTAAVLKHVRAGDMLELPGVSVSNVTFGPNSLSVTTSAGTYAFTNVSYDDAIRSYSAAVDPVTGLVAITLADQNVFTPNTKATSGSLSGDYLWSNAANWTGGVPGDGAVVSAGAVGYDDLAALQLSSLTLNEAGAAANVFVTGASLTIANLEQSGAGGTGMLEADAFDAGAPVTVTLQQSGVTGATFEAKGTHAKFLDQASTDIASNTYAVENGGLVELSNAPYSGDIFSYISSGTFAFEKPGAVISSLMLGVSIGDTIELPGTSVSNVTLGTGGLTITTDAGTYDFDSVIYSPSSQIEGYTAAVDPVTGLEAITFAGPDQLRYNPHGATLWSDPTLWSRGLPINGDNVFLSAVFGSTDDIPVLSLNSINLAGNLSFASLVRVTGTLAVSTFYAFTGDTLIADSTASGTPATITVGAIASAVSVPGYIGAIGTLAAAGAHATLIDNATSDVGTDFAVYSGGTVEVTSETPSDHSQLSYNDSLGTFALWHPAATSAMFVYKPIPGDALELPGTSVNGVTFGTNSLSVTTDVGTYSFSNVKYDPAQPIVSYTAAVDPTTGLVAITFVGPDLFEENVKATSGPLAGKYLWSNAANWSDGVPIDGGHVVVADQAAIGYDDIATLKLNSLNLSGSDLFVTGSSLTVSAVTGGGHTATDGTLYAGTLHADARDSGAPVTVTVGTITDSYAIFPDEYVAQGAGALLVDQSAVDTGEDYFTSQGGVLELDAAPASTSRFFYSTTDNDTTAPGIGVYAFENPGASITALLANVAPGDELELPGTSVSAITFGANSLNVTTDAGTYAFSNVTYGNPVTGYTAALDPTTGLEAITFTGPDVFEANVKATSGKYAGDYLWSNPANWSFGRAPVDGESVQIGTGDTVSYDDIASLSLSTLTLHQSTVNVVGSSLTVGTVDGGAVFAPQVEFGFLYADATDAGAPVSVVADTITGTRSTYGAEGAGATFQDNSATDPGDTYEPIGGGTFYLAATPSSDYLGAPANDYSDFWYGNGASVLELPHAAGVSGSDIDFRPNNVLELPGSKILSVGFTNGLSVTTDAGNYQFAGAASGVTGYSWADDASTGLVAITFTGPDVFEQNVKATSGPLAGYYLWSNPANWSQGVPVDGDNVTVSSNENLAVDDLATLTLSTLTLDGDDQLYVVGASLNAATLSSESGGSLVAGFLTTSPVSVTLGAVTGPNGLIFSDGPNTRLIDLSATDPGRFYKIDGGFLELSAPPSSNSDLSYTGGTLALENPGATSAALLGNVAPGDILELPGTSVSAVTFGANSLNVTTDAGSYDFTNVTYANPVNGYTAAVDPTTGLEAITYTDTDVFQDNVKATSGPLAGYYLWSNAANWSQGVPVDGDSVSLGAGTVTDDDVAALTLTSLTLADNAEVTVTGGALTVGSVAGSADVTRLFADAVIAGGPVTVTVDAITGIGGEYGAIGAGARFVDLSLSDPGETYRAESGGIVELSATPAAGSILAYSGTGTFELHAPGALIAAALENVAPGDVLELPGTMVDDVTYGTDSLSITTDAGSYLFSDVAYAGSATGYSAAFDASTGLEAITVACYLRGTRILTDAGEVTVEHLAIGDKVVTSRGVARPIRWIGTRSYSGRFALGQKHILPICIKAGALDDNVPRRDLWISPHHAMYLEGVLIEAKDLVNGVSIVQAERFDDVEYFHIELESHDVIIAEGARSESFIDDDSRGIFHNASDYRALYPDAPDVPAHYCAARRNDGYELEAARRVIETRAGLRPATEQPALTLRGYVDEIAPRRIAGWAQNIQHPEAPVCLDILAGGHLIGQVLANRYRNDLAAAGLGSGRHGFEFIPPAGLVFTPHTVEVRRSSDAVALVRSDKWPSAA